MVRRHPRPGLRDRRRPRARGDGPHSGLSATFCAASAPRTRGWSVDARQDLDRLPRARGDGPNRLRTMLSVLLSAPRTRGWSFAEPHPEIAAVVGPAHAGIVRDCDRARGGRGRRPRARRGWSVGSAAVRAIGCRPRAGGDGPDYLRDIEKGQVSAPRRRGRSGQGGLVVPSQWVGPAHAGMVRTEAWRSTSVACRPRARGDGPWVAHPYGGQVQSAPRTRGWSRVTRRVAGALRGQPRHAGMVPLGSRSSRQRGTIRDSLVPGVVAGQPSLLVIKSAI